MVNKTEEILNRFSDSWNETEIRFDGFIDGYPKFDRFKQIRQFIEALRQNGEDHFFRLHTTKLDNRLIISRSVTDYLRTDQKFIRIDAYDVNFEVVLRDGERIYRKYRLDDLNDKRLSWLLKTLKDTLVD
jgi:hypothetical protein